MKKILAAALAAALLLTVSGCTDNQKTVVRVEPAAAVSAPDTAPADEEAQTYILNTASGVVHRPDCRYASQIAAEHRSEITCTASELHAFGLNLCDHCRP